MGTPKILLALIALAAFAAPAAARDEGCLFCHTSKEMTERGRAPTKLFLGDSHDRAGVSCSDCHGGNGAEKDFLKAHDQKLGFLGKIRNPDTPRVCGKCHDDAEKMRSFGVAEPVVGQARELRESVHGKVRPVKEFEAPNCASCHGAHGIRSPTDPASPTYPANVPETCNRCHGDLDYMRAFTSALVRTDQLTDYRTSVHAKRLAEGDLKVAVCSSCHGNHAILPASNPNSTVYPLRVAETCGHCHADPHYMAGYRIPGPGGTERPLPTDQLARYRKSVHHAAMSERGDLSAPTCNDCHGNHGATPPQVRTVATICAQCHSRPGELFESSPLEGELEDAGYPGCATCHGHHEIQHPDDGLLATIAGGTTAAGWTPDPARREAAKGFLESIRRLETGIAGAEADVARAENYGMDLTRAHLELNRARDQLVRARVTIHTFDPAEMKAIVEGTEDEPGGLEAVRRADVLARGAFDERAFRRHGLAVALGIIALLIVLLILKIRRLEAGAG